ncbi:hypothetical protein [Rhodobacter sp. 24-YEA-8]|uniref:hypothetical protein n=1 Tax=Rhodobacter sp. 24-YEA-8 TaxID=1884310 RepID=UPI0008955C4D|nr:hypothetical protein [Rhodobacter sp. 24-YEA-8]SEB78395.1 hypothetical protein SAMN05519105_1301 [Rhodobacter sp. 24-YEA-8]
MTAAAPKGQNVSTAVMQRRVEPHDSLDDFPTPPWATRALCEWLKISAECAEEHPLMLAAREPCANRGHMVRVLCEYFATVDAADVHDYGAGFPVRDYLFGPDPELVDWTVMNPPFRLAEQFIQRGLRTSRHGIAVIVRSAFLEGVGRYRDLFSVMPPSDVLQFTERVPMHRGKLAGPGGTTATAYCWIIWRSRYQGSVTRFRWIAPCRGNLERDGDYPAEPGEFAPVDAGAVLI